MDSELLLLIIILNNYMNETTKVILLFMKFIRHDIQTNSYFSTLFIIKHDTNRSRTNEINQKQNLLTCYKTVKILYYEIIST